MNAVWYMILIFGWSPQNPIMIPNPYYKYEQCIANSQKILEEANKKLTRHSAGTLQIICVER